MDIYITPRMEIQNQRWREEEKSSRKGKTFVTAASSLMRNFNYINLEKLWTPQPFDGYPTNHLIVEGCGIEPDSKTEITIRLEPGIQMKLNFQFCI